MAQLNLKLAQFTAATAAATVTTGRKLSRNFQYYRSGRAEMDVITREELLLICHTIRMDLFGMHNLLNDEQMFDSPFLVSIAGRINDSFEELHRKLLFFDTDLITEIIQVIDQQRNYWTDYTNQNFYSKKLNQNLEIKFPGIIKKLEKTIHELPASACL